MMLVCVVFMVVNIMRDIQHFQPPPPPPQQLLPPAQEYVPTFTPYTELPPNEQEETTAWLNGRPIQTQIPPDEQETPWNKQNNNVMIVGDTETQKEAADVLAETLGKKQLDPFPILGTNQPLAPLQEEEEEPSGESSSDDEEEDGIPMVSSMQDE
jgi:hypothetical protein